MTNDEYPAELIPDEWAIKYIHDKARYIVEWICKDIEARDLIIDDALKIFCCTANGKLTLQDDRWSPDTTKYLLKNPDKCSETLTTIESPVYSDPYYDKGYRSLFDGNINLQAP